MTTIRLYTDDTWDNKHTFQVTSAIWGQPDNCEAYFDEVKTIIDRAEIGPDFKGLHSNKLSDRNWSTLGVIFKKVLNKLFQYVSEGKLNLQFTLIGKDKYNNNIEYLRELIKTQLKSENSKIGKPFSSLKKEDLPALYYRIDQLFIYLFYRDKFGDNDDQFEYYPDSTGKILNYQHKKFIMSGNLSIKMKLNFFNIIKILGNSLAQAIKLQGWPVKKQKLIKFQPQKWSANYLIQSCDILANFFFNYLRFTVGLKDEKYKLKAFALRKYFLFDDDNIKKTFSLDKRTNDIICSNKNILVTIDPINRKGCL